MVTAITQGLCLRCMQMGAPIAKGGRYDGVGEAFGRSRPATGFAIDLKAWSVLAEMPVSALSYVASPAVDCSELLVKEADLRRTVTATCSN